MSDSFDVLMKIVDPYHYLPLFIAVGFYLIIWPVKKILVSRLKRISVLTETHVDDVLLVVLDKTHHFFMIGLSIYIGFQASPFDDKKYGAIADKFFIVLFSAQIIIWGGQAITSWFDFALEKKNHDPSIKTSFGFMALLLKIVFTVAVLLFTLNNLGVNVSTFIAGLGVGGIAIALATQNILGDLFSSLSIVMDKPFIVGDNINIGEWQGEVEHVGLKTTRIRSLTGEQIIISNSDLLSSKIRNFKRMTQRRVAFQLGLTYQTKREKLMLAPKLIEQIISSEQNVRFERAHFVRYGSSSLDFEVVYWVTNPEYLDYADVHQKILFAIHEAFEVNELEFAFPTQTLFVESKKS